MGSLPQLPDDMLLSSSRNGLGLLLLAWAPCSSSHYSCLCDQSDVCDHQEIFARAIISSGRETCCGSNGFAPATADAKSQQRSSLQSHNRKSSNTGVFHEKESQIHVHRVP
jgi:hypothetical protein